MDIAHPLVLRRLSAHGEGLPPTRATARQAPFKIVIGRNFFVTKILPHALRFATRFAAGYKLKRPYLSFLMFMENSQPCKQGHVLKS